MQIPVLIERVEGNGYRARGGEPLPLVAEGSTEDEALQKLRELIGERMASGAKLVQLDVGPTEHPWAEFVGKWKDDPLIDEWMQAVEEYRREVDEDPDYL
jgi:hypothetical protein